MPILGFTMKISSRLPERFTTVTFINMNLSKGYFKSPRQIQFKWLYMYSEHTVY